MTDALIVIDMQQGSFGPETPRHDAAGLVTRLNRLARQIRTDGRRGDLHPARRRAGRSAPSRRTRLAPAADARDQAGRHGGAQNRLRCLPAHHARQGAARERHGPADHHRLCDRLLRRHHGAQRPRPRLADDRTLRWSHHGRSAAPVRHADHRPSQRDLGRFPGPRGACAGLFVHRGPCYPPDRAIGAACRPPTRVVKAAL